MSEFEYGSGPYGAGPYGGVADLLAACLAYLGEDQGWTSAEIAEAFNAEKAAQAQVCRTPATDAEYGADLAEALYRRVAHNLAVRALPLGVQPHIAEAAVATSRVGGRDPEVSRLEAPHRKLVCG